VFQNVELTGEKNEYSSQSIFIQSLMLCNPVFNSIPSNFKAHVKLESVGAIHSQSDQNFHYLSRSENENLILVSVFGVLANN